MTNHKAAQPDAVVASDDPTLENWRVKRAKHVEAVELLCDYRIESTTPFGTSAPDLAAEVMGQAHSLTILISSALMNNADGVETDHAVRSYHLGRAVDCLRSLIALASFANDGRPS